MKKTLTFLTIATLALAACGSDPAKPVATEQAKATEVVTDSGTNKKVEIAKSKRANCEKFTPIGSNRPQYRCLSVDQKKAEAEENEKEMRKATAPTAGGIGG